MSTFGQEEFAPPFREDFVRVPIGEVELALLNGWTVIRDAGDGDAVLMRAPDSNERTAA